MDTYKGRRVLNVAAAPRVINVARRAFVEIPFHEQLANARAERAQREHDDALMVASFLDHGGKVKVVRPSAKLVRKEQRFSSKGVRFTIPAIHVPIIPIKGGAISYCAPRSRG